MKRFWARRIDGRNIEIYKTLDNRERKFATDSLGEFDSRYALELAIELLSRDGNQQDLTAGRAPSGVFGRP